MGGESGPYLREGLGHKHSEACEHDAGCIGRVSCLHQPSLCATVNFRLLGSAIRVIQMLEETRDSLNTYTVVSFTRQS